jgi:sulfide:quinone oxidoreductase
LSTERKHILILGAGFGGLEAANILRKNFPSSSAAAHRITIIDKKDYFMMGLVNLWILSGIRTLQDSKISLNRLENKGIKFLNDEIKTIDVASKTVTIRSSNLELEYDYLVIALGAELVLEEVNGLL